MGGFGAEPGQVQQGSGEGSGEGLGGFGAEPGQVQQGSGEGSGEGLGGFGAEPGQAQQGFGEGSEEGSRKPWCKAKSSSTVPEKVAEAKPGQVHLTHGNLAEVFPGLGFAARFRKICKNNMLWLLGIPPKLIFTAKKTQSKQVSKQIKSYGKEVSQQRSLARKHCFHKLHLQFLREEVPHESFAFTS